MSFILRPDRTLEFYRPDGTLERIECPDGEVQFFGVDGTGEKILYPDGRTEFYEHGVYRKTEYPDE